MWWRVQFGDVDLFAATFGDVIIITGQIYRINCVERQHLETQMYLPDNISLLYCVRGKHFQTLMFSQSTFGDFDVLAGHFWIFCYILEPHSQTVMFFARPIWRNICVDHIRKRSLDVFECHIWKRAGFDEPQLEMLMYWSVLFKET